MTSHNLRDYCLMSDKTAGGNTRGSLAHLSAKMEHEEMASSVQNRFFSLSPPLCLYLSNSVQSKLIRYLKLKECNWVHVSL